MAPITDDISGPGAGETTTGLANVPTTPTYVGNASLEIDFSFTKNGNGDMCQYAVYFKKMDILGATVAHGYLTTGGVAVHDEDDSEVYWGLFPDWGAIVRATGAAMEAQYAFQFKVKAKNEAGTETDFSDYSASMATYTDLAYGPLSSAPTYECTTGDCKISGLTVTAVGENSPGQYTIAYTLTRTHNISTKNNVVIAYSTNGTDYTDIADAAITGAPGTRQTLTASAAGTANSNIWASCTTLGNAYNGTIYIRVTPYDTATAGDAADAVITTVAVDNRPLAVTVAEFSAFTWDKDTTPEWIADMPKIICGSYMFFVLRVYNSAGTEVQANSSADVSDGWYYEQARATLPGSSTRHNEAGWDTNWTACTLFGVPAAYLPPTYAAANNRIRYVMQTALTQGQTYTVKLQAAEIATVIP